ncbi:hypothetical protein LCGC14_2974200 [marine sediment metagenome]|uniref:Uncharacterized protein n=1 Tax=marine sediment metagenome TaxID=412755 RepID=A0A0F8X8K1_9ZZZZ
MHAQSLQRTLIELIVSLLPLDALSSIALVSAWLWLYRHHDVVHCDAGA